MTNDTLIAECETLLDSLDATYPDVLLGGTLAEVDTKYKADIAKLLAFARAQQAKGLRKAAKYMLHWFKYSEDDVEEAIAQLEAKATAQEKQT